MSRAATDAARPVSHVIAHRYLPRRCNADGSAVHFALGVPQVEPATATPQFRMPTSFDVPHKTRPRNAR